MFVDLTSFFAYSVPWPLFAAPAARCVPLYRRSLREGIPAGIRAPLARVVGVDGAAVVDRVEQLFARNLERRVLRPLD